MTRQDSGSHKRYARPRGSRGSISPHKLRTRSRHLLRAGGSSRRASGCSARESRTTDLTARRTRTSRRPIDGHRGLTHARLFLLFPSLLHPGLGSSSPLENSGIGTRRRRRRRHGTTRRGTVQQRQRSSWVTAIRVSPSANWATNKPVHERGDTRERRSAAEMAAITNLGAGDRWIGCSRARVIGRRPELRLCDAKPRT